MKLCKICLIALLSIISLSAFADRPSTICYNQGQGSFCLFSNLQSEFSKNYAYFYCSVVNQQGQPVSDGKVSGFNHDVLITGFDKDGELIKAPATDINKYYFAAIEDPTRRSNAIVLLFLNVLNQFNNNRLVCNGVEVPPSDRQQYPGPFGN